MAIPRAAVMAECLTRKRVNRSFARQLNPESTFSIAQTLDPKIGIFSLRLSNVFSWADA